jgi:hypothetical protein
MKYTKIIEINVGDNIECLTSDGWLNAEVLETTESFVKVYIHELGKEDLFTLDMIKI